VLVTHYHTESQSPEGCVEPSKQPSLTLFVYLMVLSVSIKQTKPSQCSLTSRSCSLYLAIRSGSASVNSHYVFCHHDQHVLSNVSNVVSSLTLTRS